MGWRRSIHGWRRRLLFGGRRGGGGVGGSSRAWYRSLAGGLAYSIDEARGSGMWCGYRHLRFCWCVAPVVAYFAGLTANGPKWSSTSPKRYKQTNLELGLA